MTSSTFYGKTAANIKRDTSLLNVTQNRKSRYVSGGVTEVSELGIEWWERSDLSSQETADERYYAVEKKFAGNIRLISALFYGTDDYWWVIAQYNNILDTFNEVQEGTILRIPNKDVVNQIMQGSLGGVPSKREVPPLKIVPIV